MSAIQGVFLFFEVKAQAINRICSFRPIGRAMGATPPPEVTVAVRSTDKGSDSIYCRFRRGLAENYFPASGTCKALTQVDCFINDYVLCQWFANYWHRESKGPPTHDLRRGKARQGKAKQYRAGLGKARQGKAMHRARLRTTPDRWQGKRPGRTRQTARQRQRQTQGRSQGKTEGGARKGEESVVWNQMARL